MLHGERSAGTMALIATDVLTTREQSAEHHDRAAVAVFIAARLFRWEKEEQLVGAYQWRTSEQIVRNRQLWRQAGLDGAIATAKENLLRAWRAGVPLVADSDADNLLVFHGPTVHVNWSTPTC